jgi:tetratricopeptide (TPR) repeat protein
MVMIYARRALEVVITELCERELSMPRGTQPLAGIIDKLKKEKKVPDHIIVSMRNLNSLSVFGAHPKDFNPRQVKPVLLDLTTVLEWYYEHFLTADTISPSEKVRKARGDVSGRKRNRILLAAGGLFAAVIIITFLIIFDVIEGFKRAGASVLILPFDNYVADSLDSFVEGMYTSTVGEMFQIDGLKVFNPITARAFKNADMSARGIADSLGVDIIVTGSVHCLSDTICLQVTGFDAEDNEIKWSDLYKEDDSQVLGLSKRFTRQFADEFRIKISAKDRKVLTKSRSVDSAAQSAYYKGLKLLQESTIEGMEQARKYFEMALERDSTYGAYYAGMAAYWGWKRQFEIDTGPEVIENANKYLNKAVELDPDHEFTIFLNASSNVWSRFDWERGEELFRRALDNRPSDAKSRAYYAQLLSILRRPDDALKEAHIALEYDPWNPLIKSLCALMEFHNGDTLVALRMAEEVLDMVPFHPVAESVTENYHFIHLSPQEKFDYELDRFYFIDEEVKDSLRKTFTEKGHEAAWDAYAEVFLRDSPYGWPRYMAHIMLIAGKHDEAVTWLEKAFEERDSEMPYISSGDRFYKPLGDHPRFIALLEKMKLPLP